MTWAIFAVLVTVYWVTGRKRPGAKRGNGRGGKGSGAGKGDKIGLIVGTFREIVLFTSLCTVVFAPLPWGLQSVGVTVGWILEWLFGPLEYLGINAALAATVLLVAAVVVFLWDVLSDFAIDKPAHIALIMLPFLVFMAAGPVAEAVTSVVTGVHTSGTNTVSSVLGQ